MNDTTMTCVCMCMTEGYFSDFHTVDLLYNHIITPITSIFKLNDHINTCR